MAVGMESNKAKIARRVVEVLDYFDDTHPQATVMDIVRRYNRPQSSTSELLSSLVELGLLYKDPYSRSYTLTPRSAMLGAIAQPDLIRNGSLVSLIDRLVAQTGLSAAIYGMVSMNAQIFMHKTGNQPIVTSNPKGISSGLQDQLANSSAGRLLLSTVSQPRRDGLIRRLNAEASEDRKFSTVEMAQQMESCRNTRMAHGAAGFGTQVESCCMLLPGHLDSQPLVVGLMYKADGQADPAVLLDCLRDAVERLSRPAENSVEPVQLRSSFAA
jgi:DNA-binding IclR family transcriptional regulator